MNTKTNPSRRGLTLIKSMIATVAIAVLVVMLVPAFQPSNKTRSKRISCICNQKQLGIAFRGFGIDMGAFPMQATVTNAPANPAPQ